YADRGRRRRGGARRRSQRVQGRGARRQVHAAGVGARRVGDESDGGRGQVAAAHGPSATAGRARQRRRQEGALMFWSRLWFLLVAVAAVGAAAMLVAEPRMAQREVDDQVQARLEAADNAADHLLRLHARKWLDAVTQVSSDAILVEALDQATRGQSDASL